MGSGLILGAAVARFDRQGEREMGSRARNGVRPHFFKEKPAMIVRRVFVSSPRDEWLDDRRKALKRAIVDKIRAAGYAPQFFDIAATGDLVSGKMWSFANADEVMRRCVGVAIIGVTRWAIVQQQRSLSLPSEYCHYEGSLARTLALPILAVAEADLERRGIFVPYGLPILPIPAGADAAWVK